MSTLGAKPGFPVPGDGYFAEVKAGNQHLRLFAEVYSLGYLAVVFDVSRKERVAREDANDLDEAKKKTEGLAAGYLRFRGAGPLPRVKWQLTAQSKAAL